MIQNKRTKLKKYDACRKILTIDFRIKNVFVEMLDTDEFYAKVWFNYKNDYSNAIQESGRTEFIANTIEKLLEQIKTYFNTDHKTYIIV